MLKQKNYVYGESLQVPLHLHFGQHMLDKMAEHKDIVALINADNNESLTYGELAQKTVDVALSLTRMGVRKGDVISICSEKRFEVMITVLGVCCAGATLSPFDITYRSAELLHRVEIARPKIIFCSTTAFDLHKTSFDSVGCIEKYIIYEDKQTGSENASNLNVENAIFYKDFLTETADFKDFLPVPVEGWKDNVLIIFSSGTTGLPKGVPLTHLGSVINSVCLINESFKGAGLLNTREWSHSYGLLFTLSALKDGVTVVYSYRNTYADWFAAVQKYKIKYLHLAPGSTEKLVKSQVLDEYDTSSVEGILSGGAPVATETVQAIKQRLLNLKGLYQVYGLSEAGCACSELNAPMGIRTGSVGTPSPGFVIKVVDLKTRQPVGPRERGEICLKSPSITPGYLGVPNRDYMDEEGFYKTGDVGYYDEDNYFYIVDRIKELIKYNGHTVVPAELEAVLLQHPSVCEVGVVGAPSEECGEAPTAFVALQPGSHATEEQLVHFLETRIRVCVKLAGGIRFLDKLPRGAAEKLDRKTLRTML